MILRAKDLKVGDVIRPRDSKLAFDDHVVIKVYDTQEAVDLMRPILTVDDGVPTFGTTQAININDHQLAEFTRIRLSRTKELFPR